MYQDQLICIVTKLKEGSADAVRALVEKSEQQLKCAFGKLGQVHFASLSLLPPRPGKSKPSLALELVLDEDVVIAEITDRLVDAGFEWLGPLYQYSPKAPIDESRRKQWLKHLLESTAQHAHGGYVGTRDCTVEQIHREAALFEATKTATRLAGSPVDRTQFAHAIASKMQADRFFDDVKKPALRSSWREPGLHPIRRIFRILVRIFDELLPVPVARSLAIVLVSATLIVALAGAGVFALMAAAPVVGWDTIFGGTAFFGFGWVEARVVSIDYLIALLVLLALTVMALSGMLPAAVAYNALRGLLIFAVILAIKNLLGISYCGAIVSFVAWLVVVSALMAWRPALGILAWWSSIIGFFALWSVPIAILAFWAGAAALYVAATFAGVAILMVAVTIVVRPYLGRRVLLESMLLALLLVVYAFGAFGPASISLALFALMFPAAIVSRVRSRWIAASAYVRRSAVALAALAIAGTVTLATIAFSIPWIASLGYGLEQFLRQRLVELTAVFSVSHRGYSSFALVASIWIAGFLVGAVLLVATSSWIANRVASTLGRLNRPGEETWRTQIAKWSRRANLDGKRSLLSDVIESLERKQTSASQRYQQTHLTLVRCEGALRNRCNHMVSVTELRWPHFWHAWKLRFWLWVVGQLGDRWWAEGTLGHARGIHFAHWHLIDRGRRLLFLSNYDGDFSGYLDEFILGALAGINLIWGRSKLKPRPAAATDDPSIGAPRGFPPRRLLFFAGCSNEQWFKAYVRDSMVPHLLRFDAYPFSCTDIERATRLRDALSDPRDQVRDDQIMRAIES